METLLWYLLCLLSQKKIFVHISYLFGTILFITFTYNTANRLQTIPDGAPVIQWRLSRNTTSQNEEKKSDSPPDQCGNIHPHPQQLVFRSLRTSNFLNHLGFVLRSRSLFYCSVPKVATRSLLTYVTYLYIRDELIPSLKSRTIPFDANYFNTILNNSIQTDSSSLLWQFLSAMKVNGSGIDLWALHQQKALPDLRPHTLADPSALFSPSFTRAIFVRHPLERLASAYADKIGSVKLEPFSFYDAFRRRICRKLSSPPPSHGRRRAAAAQRLAHANRSSALCASDIPSFEQFVDYILQDSSQEDVHWQPYSSLCSACRMKYNFVGRYETMQEDWRALQRKLGLNTTEWDLKKEFSTGKTKENYKGMYAKLSKELLCNLKDFYRHDLRLFNYRFEDSLPDPQELQCPSRFYLRYNIQRP